MTSNHPTPPPIPPKPRHFPHIQDLVHRSNDLGASESASAKHWVDKAQRHWHQAKWSKSMGRLDHAYVDYLLAYTIVSTVIPRCLEYPTFRNANSKDYATYMELRKTLQASERDFKDVKEAIIRDNEMTGVQCSSAPERNGNGEISHRKAGSDAARPEVRPKPQYLSSNPNPPVPPKGPTQSNGDDLMARFEKLSPMRTNRPYSTPSNGLPASLIPGGGAAGRQAPQGPREMPSSLSKLDVKNALPQLPAPTYSPTTSYSPPRSSTRASLPAVVSPQPNGVSSAKLPPPGQTSLTAEMLYSYIRAGTNLLLLDIRPRAEYEQGHIFARSVVCIEPITLHEGMSGDDLEERLVLAPARENELFKKRSDFDLVIYYDQSTREINLHNSAADNEYQSLLRILRMALDDFNITKPLRQKPLLLAGGLDSWIDCFGLQSLQIPRPTPPLDSIAYKRSREVSKGPTPLLLGRSDARSQARPPQGLPYPTTPNGTQGKEGVYASMPAAPINSEEEERKWLELLQKESDPVTFSVPGLDTGNDSLKKRRRGTSIVSNNPIGYVRSVEEFIQQYPASPHGQESMTMPGFPTSPSSPRRTNTIIDHPFHVFTDVRNPEFNPPVAPTRPPPAAPRKSYSGVSERLASPVPQALPERAPKIPMVPQAIPGMGNFNIGITGLKNLGNTCYMNSILQCLSGTIPLARYFLDGTYRGHINKENPLGSRGILAEAFATVVRHLWSGEYKFISPVTFKDVAGRLNETFKSDDQQDAQEFLAFLLDGLHEDLNPNASRPKLKALTDEEERRRERLPLQVASFTEWRRYLLTNDSIAVRWLQGQLSSRLKCLTCSVTSTTYSAFMYLSIPIPVVQNRPFSLHDCLKEFTKEEILEGDDAWHCPNCKKPRKATKKLTITRLPHVLIIHLKRFTNQGRWRDKLNTAISFPLTNLDLTGYVPPPLPPDSGGEIKIEQEVETSPPFMYDLYGIANHYGTLHGGHYTAFVKDPYKGVWNTFDDSKSSKMQENAVVSRNSYVLFWVRKHVM